MTRVLKAIPLALAALAMLTFAGMVLAENTDPANDNSQFAWAENAGWLNAEPANCAGCGLTVTDTNLTGYLWSENLGWVNLSCVNNGTCAGPAGNWGVANDGLGALRGYAWSENAGWINFSCTTNAACAGPAGNWGVAVDRATGIFSGFAWGENLGWISFSDSNPQPYQVRSAWPTSDEDGYSDSAEAGIPLCLNSANDDAFDDAVVNDGCPGGPAQAGAYSEAQFKIGTGAQDPCGFDGWPSNIWDAVPSNNQLDVQDVLAFVAPIRRLDTSPPNANYNPRWDVTPGKTAPFPHFINIVDITTLVQGPPNSPAYPPMFGGLRAFTKDCPFAP
jgi:hypothetical protein